MYLRQTVLAQQGKNLQRTQCSPSLNKVKVTPTTFWLKCIPKCTKFCSTRKLEIAYENFDLLTKIVSRIGKYGGKYGSVSGNICVVCFNL